MSAVGTPTEIAQRAGSALTAVVETAADLGLDRTTFAFACLEYGARTLRDELGAAEVIAVLQDLMRDLDPGGAA